MDFLNSKIFEGISWMMLSAALFAIADALGKQLSEFYPFWQIIFLRATSGMLIIGLMMIVSGRLGDIRTSQPLWQLSRSVVGILMTTGIFMGLKYVPLAEVTALVFTTPLIVAIYAASFQKEKIGRANLSAVILGFIGVLLVVKPTPEHFHPAHLFVLGFSVSSAFMSITARKLVSTESVLALNFYIYPLSALLAAWWAIPEWQPISLKGWILVLAVAVLATFAMICITRAMHCAKPTVVAPFDYTRIIWTVSLGWLIWGELPDRLSIAGIVIIIGAGLYLIAHPYKID
jgi:drug/metabolite transporter (DMT)-like permease